MTPNTITVIGLGITIVAATLVALDWLLLGAAILTAGSLLDAVDGALARATGGATPFGSFLDSTLDRAGEAILYTGIAAWFLLDRPLHWAAFLCISAGLAVAGFSVRGGRAERDDDAAFDGVLEGDVALTGADGHGAAARDRDGRLRCHRPGA